MKNDFRTFIFFFTLILLFIYVSFIYLFNPKLERKKKRAKIAFSMVKIQNTEEKKGKCSHALTSSLQTTATIQVNLQWSKIVSPRE